MSLQLDNKTTNCCYDDTSTIIHNDDNGPPDSDINNVDEDDWIAVKPFFSEACVNLNKEIVNIVSISVEKEKVSLILNKYILIWDILSKL